MADDEVKDEVPEVEGNTFTDESGDAGDDFDGHIDGDEEGEGIVLQQRYPWDGTDRDYIYDELLGRVFNILRENNPELAGDRRRTVMRPPQVLREGTKKTVFLNLPSNDVLFANEFHTNTTPFLTTSWLRKSFRMHRQPDHVMAFLLAELGTSGSLDGQQRLVVKGRFAPKNFEGILRRYINEYVICLGCKSPDTILSKENRLFFLRCEKRLMMIKNCLHCQTFSLMRLKLTNLRPKVSGQVICDGGGHACWAWTNRFLPMLKHCGSGRSVAPIKAGFVARVGRRNAGT
ncbi:hypothetical protein GOBAR_DD16517 [Gossypium barbadense]|nr:hypothetical protein GOBAR_DD16517 [Gossypium barbadense]